jgi:PIF1-like helicase
MLAFLKPWRDLRDLKEGYDDWECAFNGYMQSANQRDKDVISGCQYYYDSRNVADSRGAEEETNLDVDQREDDNDEVDVGNEFREETLDASVSSWFFKNKLTHLINIQTSISDEDVFHYEMMQRQDREYMHGQLAVEAAKIWGIFPDNDISWIVNEEHEVEVKTARGDINSTLQRWRHHLEQSSAFSSDCDLETNNIEHTMEATVIPISDLSNSLSDNTISIENEKITAMNVDKLNEEQRRAYDIVDRHLEQTITGKFPSQLLMLIPGEGSVGKLRVIQTRSQNFERRNIGYWCVKGAYTGIAASLIDGKTLHVLGGIPIRGGKQSSHTLKKLREFWKTKKYLIIDEVSMLSRSFFAIVLLLISILRLGKKRD